MKSSKKLGSAGLKALILAKIELGLALKAVKCLILTKKLGSAGLEKLDFSLNVVAAGGFWRLSQ